MLRHGIVLLFVLINLTFINCNNDPSIIIVGAGAAGISAAARLLEHNFKNLTILEAENRIGGRIFTTTFGNYTVDLGAQWCHGRDGNVVYQLAGKFDLLGKERDVGEALKYSLVHSSGEKMDRELVVQIVGIFWGLYDNETSEQEVSQADVLPKRFIELVKDTYKNDSITKLASELLPTFISSILAQDGAFSIHDVSLNQDFEECEGGDYYWKTGGYSNILNILMRKYPDSNKELPVLEKTKLGKEVNKISWDDEDEPIEVTCSDGSKYLAEYVILTPSLGVLKHRYQTLFEPPLPKQKANAIEDLGIAAVMKMFWLFDEPWWPSHEFTGFAFVWSEEDRKNLVKEYPDGPNENGRSWLLDTIGVFCLSGQPNLLSIWFAGPSVSKIEQLSDAEITAGVMFLLNKFLGDSYEEIPEPKAALRNKWYSNNHFRGTYSFQTVESRQSGLSPEMVIAEPLMSGTGNLKILFAGEATHPIYYSTVHGAIESGKREADRILNMHK